MNRVGWALALGLTGCVTPYGQKVRALLTEDEVSCVEGEDGPALASLQLDREDDLYVAEIVDRATGGRMTVPSTRDGVMVTFVCPDGLDGFTVRRASILNQVREDPSADDPPAAP